MELPAPQATALASEAIASLLLLLLCYCCPFLVAAHCTCKLSMSCHVQAEARANQRAFLVVLDMHMDTEHQVPLDVSQLLLLP